VFPRISTFLAAALRVSSLSQPNSLIVVRYSSRNNTAADHAMITWVNGTSAHHSCGEFWHTTGQAHAPWWGSVPQHALDVRGRWSLLVVHQSGAPPGCSHGAAVSLGGQNCPGRAASGV
jgi:hypothetical protein